MRSHEQFASRIVRLSEVLPSSTWDCTARHCMDATIDCRGEEKREGGDRCLSKFLNLAKEGQEVG